jgi:hypothetical protein
MTYNAEQITFMLADAIDQNREYKSWHVSTKHLMTLVERVVAEEREACAKVCDDMEEKAEGTECCKWPTPMDCAYAIRARSNP